jgi:hypothetical protein
MRTPARPPCPTCPTCPDTFGHVDEMRSLPTDREARISGPAPILLGGMRAATQEGVRERREGARASSLGANGEKHMSRRRISKILVGFLGAFALAGCTAEAMPPGDGPVSEGDAPADRGIDEGQDLGATSQPLGSFSHVLPRRGSLNNIVDTRFLGSGMTYAMVLRTGDLVDAVSASFYTPSNPNNRYTPGDPFFLRGPAGGTAGSEQPRLECPAGFAAFGLCGRSGNRLDELGLLCAQIGSDGRPIVSTQRAIGAFGGNGGTPFIDTCGTGKWLSGMMVSVALKSSGTNKIVSAIQGYCSNAI